MSSNGKIVAGTKVRIVNVDGGDDWPSGDVVEHLVGQVGTVEVNPQGYVEPSVSVIFNEGEDNEESWFFFSSEVEVVED